jgi:hypothetical protein
LDFDTLENLIRTVAPDDLADKLGDHWNVGPSLVFHGSITHKTAKMSKRFDPDASSATAHPLMGMNR